MVAKRLLASSFAPTLALLVGLAGAILPPGCSQSSGGRSSAVAPITSSAAFTVIASTPTDGELDVQVDASLYLTMSEDVDAASLAPGAVILQSDQGAVPAALRLATPRVIEVDPLANLVSTTPHLLRVTTALLDVAGRPLAGEQLIKFTTSATVPIVGPGSGHTIAPAIPGPYVAGAASADMTPGVGVPLGGFGGGDRRRSFPDLNPFNEYTFLEPSVGVKDPLMAKCLVLGNGHERVAIVTIDAVATDAEVVETAWGKAQSQGFTVPLEKVMVCASHTHSGPGALTKRLLWQVTAVDLYVRRVFEHVTDRIAQAMVQAEQGVGPAVVGLASTQVTTATKNRRAADSPRLDDDDIDPEMVVIRVDRPTGVPVATVWNFGIHGTHFGTSNLEFSADIMGSANIKAEAAGAGVCLFINGCEGDIRPTGGYDATGQVLADAILQARNAASTQTDGVLQSACEQVDLGQPALSLALHRNAPPNIAHSGFVQGLASLGITLGIDFNIPNGWIEREFRFQAIRIDGSVLTTLPGEPLHEIGLTLKSDGKALGFEHVIPAALANGHGAYFTTDQEFQFGGYEGMATLFGAHTGSKVTDASRRQMQRLKP